ncbi:hypothetical protein [Maribacter sp. 2-571]|uniref:hypothetical protein n=1 Tax=Maribacter sp. 2-571 TaxID=3417569 RepID=UPI003D34276A
MFYNVTEHYDSVGEKELPHRCPDCHQKNCLRLHFYQKRIVSAFSTKNSKKVSGVLFCRHTQTEVSPVLWTDEIENFFHREKKTLQLAPTGIKLHKRFYLVIAIPIAAFLFGMAYHTWQTHSYEEKARAIAAVSEGEKVGVMISFIKNRQTAREGTTWLLVTKIAEDTIWLRVHKQLSDDPDFAFDLSDSSFGSRQIKASLPRFKERFLTGFDYTDQHFSGYITDIKK